MRRRRMGRPGLVGTMARTAVVAGTATAVVGGVHNRQAGKQQAAAEQAESQAQMAQMQADLDQVKAQQAPPPPPPPPAPGAGGGVDVVAELTKLADLKAQGVLDDAEFAAAKAKLLAS